MFKKCFWDSGSLETVFLANFYPYNYSETPLAFEVIDKQATLMHDANLAGISETLKNAASPTFAAIGPSA
jgi:hypothetical protein